MGEVGEEEEEEERGEAAAALLGVSFPVLNVYKCLLCVNARLLLVAAAAVATVIREAAAAPPISCWSGRVPRVSIRLDEKKRRERERRRRERKGGTSLYMDRKIKGGSIRKESKEMKVSNKCVG